MFKYRWREIYVSIWIQSEYVRIRMFSVSVCASICVYHLPFCFSCFMTAGCYTLNPKPWLSNLLQRIPVWGMLVSSVLSVPGRFGGIWSLMHALLQHVSTYEGHSSFFLLRLKFFLSYFSGVKLNYHLSFPFICTFRNINQLIVLRIKYPLIFSTFAIIFNDFCWVNLETMII